MSKSNLLRNLSHSEKETYKKLTQAVLPSSVKHRKLLLLGIGAGCPLPLYLLSVIVEGSRQCNERNKSM